MNPDGTQDSFGVAFRGDDAGNIWQDGVQIFFAGDKVIREVVLGTVTSTTSTDLLKISGCVRLRVIVDCLYASSCLEDAIDINHSHDIEVLVNDLFAAKNYCATIKGGSTNIRIVVARQHGHGGETDYDLGNFSDQSNARTTGVSLHINTEDRSPVRVRVLSADKPKLENEDQITYFKPQLYSVRLFNQGWFYHVYNFLKDFLKNFHIYI
jgi:hypothetical protein